MLASEKDGAFLWIANTIYGMSLTRIVIGDQLMVLSEYTGNDVYYCSMSGYNKQRYNR